MNWLRKYWIFPVIAIIVGFVLWILYKVKNTAGVNDGPPNNPGLLGNENKYLNWGVTCDVKKATDTVTISGQGNGNYFNASWTLSELLAIRNAQNGSYASYWEEILISEYSDDGDFYIGAVLAGEVATNVVYIWAGVFDPRESAPNIPSSTGAKAALRVNNLMATPQTVILVEPSTPVSNTNSTPGKGGAAGK